MLWFYFSHIHLTPPIKLPYIVPKLSVHFPLSSSFFFVSFFVSQFSFLHTLNYPGYFPMFQRAPIIFYYHKFLFFIFSLFWTHRTPHTQKKTGDYISKCERAIIISQYHQKVSSDKRNPKTPTNIGVIHPFYCLFVFKFPYMYPS